MEFENLLLEQTFEFEFKGFKITGIRKSDTVAVFSIDSEKYASYNNSVEAQWVASSIKLAIAEAIFYTKYHGISTKGIDRVAEISEIYYNTFGKPIHQFSLQRFKK